MTLRPRTLVRETKQLLGPKEFRRGLLLILMTTFGALLEAIGIGLIVPFLSLLTEAKNEDVQPWLGVLFNEFDSPIHSLGLVLLLVFVFKNVFLAVLSYIQLDFSARNQVLVSTRLFDNYLKRSIEFYSDRNSADLLRNVFEEVRLTFSHVIQPAMVIVAEIGVVISLALLVVLTSPLSATFAIVLVGAAGAAFYGFIRKHVARFGEIQQREAGELIRWAQQGFGAIRELLVNDRQDYFTARYQSHVFAHADAAKKGQFARLLPRYAVETLGIAGLLAVLFALLSNSDSKGVLPLMSLFALAAVRIMPSVTRIIASLTSILHHYPSLRVVAADLAGISAAPASEKPVQWSGDIHLENVSFSYSGSVDSVLRNVSLVIPSQRTTAIVGMSGSGKTTLAALILGLLQPSEGRIGSKELRVEEAPFQWRRRFGYIPQPIYLLDASISENVALGVERETIDLARVREVLKVAQLSNFVDSLPKGLATTAGEVGGRLSGGQRQRIGIARALYHDPEIVILDEATSALDPSTEAEITKALQNLHGQKTMIVIAHRLQTIRDADQIVFLEDGQVACTGDFRDVKERFPSFARFVELSRVELE